MNWYHKVIPTGDSAKVRMARSDLLINLLRRRILQSTAGLKRLRDADVTDMPQRSIRTRINDYTFPVRDAIHNGVRRILTGGQP